MKTFNFKIWCTLKGKNIIPVLTIFFFTDSAQIKKNSLGLSTMEDNNFQAVSITSMCNLPLLSAASLRQVICLSHLITFYQDALWVMSLRIDQKFTAIQKPGTQAIFLNFLFQPRHINVFIVLYKMCVFIYMCVKLS